MRNAADKTTTVRMLCTLARPTGGRATVAGFDVARQPRAVRRRIGLVFQEQTLDDRLTAEQNLRFHAVLYHVPHEETGQRMDRALRLVGLAAQLRLGATVEVQHHPVVPADDRQHRRGHGGEAGTGQRLRRLERYRHPAARQAEHHRRLATQVPQPGGQPPPGLITISENHHNHLPPASPQPVERLGDLGPRSAGFRPWSGLGRRCTLCL
jgi:hypothetical protein